MVDHMDALSKQLASLQIKTAEESKSYSEHLSNYTSTRDDYIAKYRAFPLVKELEEAQKALAVLQERDKENEKSKEDIAERISALKAELDTKVMSRIVVKIVQSKFSNQRLESEIHDCVTEKTVLLGQLKEVQKSKQQEQEASSLLNMESGEPNQGKTGLPLDIVGTRKNFSKLNTLCSKDPSLCSKDPSDSGNAVSQPLEREEPQDPNTDTDEDVSMTETGQALQHHGEHIQEVQPVHHRPQAAASDQVQGRFNTDRMVEQDRSGTSKAVDQDYTQVTSQERPVTQAKTCDTTKPTPRVMVPNVPNKANVPRALHPGQPRMYAIRRPRLPSKIPSVPALPRMPPALRIPTLTVPKPLRLPQPCARVQAPGAIKKGPTPAATPLAVPRMKQPTPPPPKSLLTTTSTSQLTRREKLSLPTLPSAPYKSGPKTGIPTSTSASTPVRQLQCQPQPLTADGDGASKSGYSNENAEPTAQQRKPLPEPYFMPLNDVACEATAVDKDQDMASTDQQMTVRTAKASGLFQREQDMEITENEPAIFTSTPNEKGEAGDFSADLNEPLFKLDHTFGSQSSLGSTAPNFQPQSQPKDQRESFSPKTGLLAHLTMAGSLASPDNTAADGESDHKSFFNLFTISQKTDNTCCAEGDERNEEEGSAMSVFNFGKFGATQGSDEDSSKGGWMGASGLMGMTGNTQTQGTSDAEDFSFKLGSAKEQDDDGGDQPSFFNLGGGGLGDFNTSDISRPIFNLF